MHLFEGIHFENCIFSQASICIRPMAMPMGTGTAAAAASPHPTTRLARCGRSPPAGSGAAGRTRCRTGRAAHRRPPRARPPREKPAAQAPRHQRAARARRGFGGWRASGINTLFDCRGPRNQCVWIYNKSHGYIIIFIFKESEFTVRANSAMRHRIAQMLNDAIEFVLWKRIFPVGFILPKEALGSIGEKRLVTQAKPLKLYPFSIGEPYIAKVRFFAFSHHTEVINQRILVLRCQLVFQIKRQWR